MYLPYNWKEGVPDAWCTLDELVLEIREGINKIERRWGKALQKQGKVRMKAMRKKVQKGKDSTEKSVMSKQRIRDGEL